MSRIGESVVVIIIQPVRAVFGTNPTTELLSLTSFPTTRLVPLYYLLLLHFGQSAAPALVSVPKI